MAVGAKECEVNEAYSTEAVGDVVAKVTMSTSEEVL